MNMNILKGKLREKNKTYQEAAKELGVSTTTFNLKINGKSPFNCDEAILLSRFLGLSSEEKLKIFFGM